MNLDDYLVGLTHEITLKGKYKHNIIAARLVTYKLTIGRGYMVDSLSRRRVPVANDEMSPLEVRSNEDIRPK